MPYLHVATLYTTVNLCTLSSSLSACSFVKSRSASLTLALFLCGELPCSWGGVEDGEVTTLPVVTHVCCNYQGRTY